MAVWKNPNHDFALPDVAAQALKPIATAAANNVLFTAFMLITLIIQINDSDYAPNFGLFRLRSRKNRAIIALFRRPHL